MNVAVNFEARYGPPGSRVSLEREVRFLHPIADDTALDRVLFVMTDPRGGTGRNGVRRCVLELDPSPLAIVA